MHCRPVTLSARVTVKTSPRAKPRELQNTQEIIKTKMTKSDNQITVNCGFTYPGILGDFSSMHVSVSMTIPADTAKIKTAEDMRTVVDPYNELVGTYVTNTLSKACVQLGKPDPFGSTE